MMLLIIIVKTFMRYDDMGSFDNVPKKNNKKKKKIIFFKSAEKGKGKQKQKRQNNEI